MPTEVKKKIQAWVPVPIWIQIESFGFKSQNEAVNTAFEKLIEIQDNNQLDSKNNQLDSNMINELRARLEVKDKQIEEAQRQIKDLEESLKTAPDLGEFARLQARSEELEKAEKDKEYLKGQIAIKDQQLDKQAFSLQSVIQENSRLNVKLLPENTEVLKKWWKFW